MIFDGPLMVAPAADADFGADADASYQAFSRGNTSGSGTLMPTGILCIVKTTMMEMLEAFCVGVDENDFLPLSIFPISAK